MDFSDLIKSGIGAVLGFALAQFVDLGRLLSAWIMRPRLVIESPYDNWLVLSHSVEIGSGELCDEEVYGFNVRNVGRRIATGVHFQLLKLERRDSTDEKFTTVSDDALELSLYSSGQRSHRSTQTSLVPGAAALVELARWREDYFVVMPSVATLPEYYEETCTGSVEYRFTVVALYESARFVREVLTIKA
jgi:hypothetical protein